MPVRPSCSRGGFWRTDGAYGVDAALKRAEDGSPVRASAKIVVLGMEHALMSVATGLHLVGVLTRCGCGSARFIGAELVAAIVEQWYDCRRIEMYGKTECDVV